MAYELEDIVRKVFDRQESPESRRAQLQEFLNVLATKDIEEVSFDDIKAAFAEITVSVDARDLEKELIQGVLDAVLAKSPSPEKIAELRLPLLAAYIRNIGMVKKFAELETVDVTEGIQIAEGKIRGASILRLAASNRDEKSNEIFEFLVSRETAESTGKIDIGEWIGIFIASDNIEAAIKRYEKYKDKLEVSQTDIGSSITTITALLALEEMEPDLQQRLLAMRIDMVSRVDILDPDTSLVNIANMRLMTEETYLEKDPVARARENELALKLGVVSPTGVAVSETPAASGYNIQFNTVMRIFTDAANDLDTKDRNKLLRCLVSHKATPEQNLISIIADEKKLQEFARALGKDTALMKEFAKLMKQNPHLRPFEMVVEDKIKEVHQKRHPLRRATLYVASPAFSGANNLNDFLAPHKNELSGQTVEAINELLEQIDANKYLNDEQKDDLSNTLKELRGAIIDASFISDKQVSYKVEDALNIISLIEPIMRKVQDDVELEIEVNALEWFIKQTCKEHDMKLDPKLEARIAKLGSLQGDERASEINEIYEKHFEQVVDKWLEDQKAVVERLDQPDDKKQQAIDILEERHAEIQAQVIARGGEFVREAKKDASLFSVHVVDELTKGSERGTQAGKNEGRE